MEKKHHLLNKLLVKQRNLQIDRNGIYVYLLPYQQTYQIIFFTQEDYKKLIQMNVELYKWDLINLQINKVLTFKLKKHIIGLEQFFTLLKPPKFKLKIGQKNLYLLAMMNPTINISIQNIKESKTMDSDIYNYISKPQLQQIPVNILPYNQLQVKDLNQSQKTAINKIMTQKITLIKGPPGTGKTTLFAKITHLIAKTGLKLMICGPSNIACDAITKAILKNFQNTQIITRFPSQIAKNKKVIKQLEQITFQQKILKKLSTEQCLFYKQFEQNLQRFINKQELIQTKVLDKAKFEKQRLRLYQSVLKQTQILSCTIITAASGVLDNFLPDVLLIDQSSQSTQPQVLGVLNKGADKIAFIGDQMQLTATVISNNQILKESMFVRLLKQKPKNFTLLDTQYRMHPIIAQFISKQFYKNKIKNGISSEDRLPKTCVKILRDCPLLIIDHPNLQKSVGTSYQNILQVNIIQRLIKKYFIQIPSQVGIITGFKPQQNQLKIRLQKQIQNGLQIQTFDGFQGNQKEYIIISFVRSNQLKSIGFLNSSNRANVALSRAKRGVILVGNVNTMNGDQNNAWRSLIEYYKKLRKIQNYEGIISEEMNNKNQIKKLVEQNQKVQRQKADQMRAEIQKQQVSTKQIKIKGKFKKNNYVEFDLYASQRK